VLDAGAPLVVAREFQVVSRDECGDQGRTRCPAGIVGNGDRLLVERAAEQSHVGGVVDDRISRRHLRPATGKRGIRSRQPRRNGHLPHQFVPILPDARVDRQAAEGLPVVVQVRGEGSAGTVEITAATEGGFKNRQTRQQDQLVAGTLKFGRVVQTLRVRTSLQLMPPREVQNARKVVREDLRTAPRLMCAHKVVSAAALGSDHIKRVSQRSGVANHVLPGEAQCQGGAVLPQMRLLDGGNHLAVAQRARGGDGIEHTQSVVRLVVEIREQVGEQNVRWCEVHLNMRQVAGGPTGIGILALG